MDDRKNERGLISRRTFVEGVAAEAGIMIVPRPVTGGVGYEAPRDRVNVAVAAYATGGMGVILMDAAYAALKVGHPTSLAASAHHVLDVTKDDGTTSIHRVTCDDSFPPASVSPSTFPERGKRYPAVQLHWYDGGIRPRRLLELEADRRMPTSGAVIVREKGMRMCEAYAGQPPVHAGLGKEDAPAPEEDDSTGNRLARTGVD